MSILDDIARARHVRVFVDPAYDDYIEGMTVPISRPMARQLVGRAPEGAKPTARWHGNLLLTLIPQCSDERIILEDD